MFSIQQKIRRHAEKQSVTSEWFHMLDVTHRLQSSYCRYFEEIKGTMFKEVKESVVTMNEWRISVKRYYKREQNCWGGTQQQIQDGRKKI